MSMRRSTTAAAAILAIALAACQQNEPADVPPQTTSMEDTTAMGAAPSVTKAVAVLRPTDGHAVHGTVTFMKSGDVVEIEGAVEGLTPGPHGFHVHAYGDVTAPDGSSAGDHFNPLDHEHGGPDAATRHAGDLGNIVADENGIARIAITDSLLQLDGEHSIIGRGLVVHQGTDDLTSQPSGDAGARLAVGVIGIAS